MCQKTKYITALSGAGYVNDWQSIQRTQISAWLGITWQAENAVWCWFISSSSVAVLKAGRTLEKLNSQKPSTEWHLPVFYYRYCKIFMLVITVLIFLFQMAWFCSFHMFMEILIYLTQSIWKFAATWSNDLLSAPRSYFGSTTSLLNWNIWHEQRCQMPC